MRCSSLALPLLAAACAMPAAIEPSLAPRRAEAIDPRVPIPAEPPVGQVDAGLGQRLEQLVNEVHASRGSFEALASQTERLVAAAGPAQSESWIAAQQSLSALVAARAPVTRAMADIDELASRQIRSGGLAAADLAAIQAALAEAGAINQRQAETIDRLQAALSR